MALYVCGLGTQGQLGDGGVALALGGSAARRVAVGGPVRAVACGADTTAVLRADGVLLVCGAGVLATLTEAPRVWGAEDILGVFAGALSYYVLTAEHVYVRSVRRTNEMCLELPRGELQFRGGSGGALFAVVWCASGSVYSTGCNAYGQLGVGSEDDKLSTTQLLRVGLEDGAQVLTASCGGAHTVAVTAAGYVMGWGRNDGGQLGAHDDVLRTPVHLRDMPADVVGVACGDGHTMLLTARDEVYAMGRTARGIAGDGAAAHRRPVLVRTHGAPRVMATNGGHGVAHAVLIDVEGNVYGAGSNADGQLGSHSGGEGFAALDVPRCKGVACGWRHTVMWSDEECGDVTRSYGSLGTLSVTLVVLEHIVVFLGCRGALQFGAVSRFTHDCVRHCWPLWERPLLKWLPYSWRRARRDVRVGASVDLQGMWQRSHHEDGRYIAVEAGGVCPEDDVAEVEAPPSTVWSRMSSWLATKTQRKKDNRVLFLGLDGAGKTTLLYRLRLGEVVVTMPTIGLNVETIEVGGSTITCWDIGGPDKMRPLWRHYYQSTRGIIFVVDSNDVDRMQYAAQEIHQPLKEAELATCTILVLANKQDLRGAMHPERVADILQLPPRRRWRVQGCSAITGRGVMSGIRWLMSNIEDF